MYKKLIFIAIFTFIASCKEDVKPPVPKEDEILVIDTLQVVGLNLALEWMDPLERDNSKESQDLMVSIKNGYFKNLGDYYYGSERYSELLKVY